MTEEDFIDIAMSHQVSPYEHHPELTVNGAKTHDFDQWMRQGAMEREVGDEMIARWRQRSRVGAR